MARALASHQCGPGSIPGLDAISGLSLCWFFSLLRKYFPGFSGFPPKPKTSIQLAVSCAQKLQMDSVAATSSAYVCFRFGAASLLFFATAITSDNYYCYYYYHYSVNSDVIYTG